MEKNKKHALVICFIGIILAVVIFGSLIGAYTNIDPDDKKSNKIIDIVGTFVIIICSIIYWWIFTHYKCVSYNLASLWPRLAFRYGLGAGIFFGIFQLMAKKNTESNTVISSFEDYYPLLVLSLIFGNYFFIFLEISAMDNHNCLINIKNL